MKKSFKKWLALTTAVVSVGGVFALTGCGNSSSDLGGYVAVDINPSIEFITNDYGKVTEIRAVNDDAKIVISDMELVGKDISFAIEAVTKASEETGFITEANLDVSITVGGDTEVATQKLQEIAEKAVKKGCEKAVIKADAIKVALEAELEKIKESNPTLYENLTAAKLKVINSIMKFDREFTVEMGVEMSMEQLVDLLETHVDQFEDFFDDKFETAFKEKMNELSQFVHAQIDNIIDGYNQGYAEVKAQLRQLEVLEEKIEEQLEEAMADGTIDFEFDRDFDEDDQVLTQEMIDQITAIIGENTITTLGQLDDFIDEIEEQVEEIEERVQDQLSIVHKELIKGLEAQLKQFEEQAREYVKTLADALKEQYKDTKAQLKLQLGNRHQNGKQD